MPLERTLHIERRELLPLKDHRTLPKLSYPCTWTSRDAHVQGCEFWVRDVHVDVAHHVHVHVAHQHVHVHVAHHRAAICVYKWTSLKFVAKSLERTLLLFGRVVEAYTYVVSWCGTSSCGHVRVCLHNYTKHSESPTSNIQNIANVPEQLYTTWLVTAYTQVASWCGTSSWDHLRVCLEDSTKHSESPWSALHNMSCEGIHSCGLKMLHALKTLQNIANPADNSTKHSKSLLFNSTKHSECPLTALHNMSCEGIHSCGSMMWHIIVRPLACMPGKLYKT